MSRRPQEESIYTLQRRIGRQGHLLDALSKPSHEAPDSKEQPQPRRFTLGTLFSARVRAA